MAIYSGFMLVYQRVQATNMVFSCDLAQQTKGLNQQKRRRNVHIPNINLRIVATEMRRVDTGREKSMVALPLDMEQKWNLCGFSPSMFDKLVNFPQLDEVNFYIGTSHIQW